MTSGILDTLVWNCLPEETLVKKLAAKIRHDLGLRSLHRNKTTIRQYVKDTYPPRGMLQKRLTAVMEEITRQIDIANQRARSAYNNDKLSLNLNRRYTYGYLQCLRKAMIKRFAPRLADQITGQTIIDLIRTNKALSIISRYGSVYRLWVYKSDTDVKLATVSTVLNNVNVPHLFSLLVFNDSNYLINQLAAGRTIKIDRFNLGVLIDDNYYCVPETKLEAAPLCDLAPTA